MFRSTPPRSLLRRLVLLALFVAMLWGVQAVNWLLGYALNPSFGLIPRTASGLDGVIGMPLLHASFAHLISNTPPLLVLGTLLALSASRNLVALNAIVVGLGGGLVWLLAGPAVHIGASGLIFGWSGFLLARGIVERSPMTIGAALVVGLLYGTMAWGLLPGQPGISWEAHLFGAIAGVAAALVLRPQPSQNHRRRR